MLVLRPLDWPHRMTEPHQTRLSNPVATVPDSLSPVKRTHVLHDAGRTRSVRRAGAGVASVGGGVQALASWRNLVGQDAVEDEDAGEDRRAVAGRQLADLGFGLQAAGSGQLQQRHSEAQ